MGLGFVRGRRLSELHGHPGAVWIVADRARRVPHCHATISLRHRVLYESDVKPNRAELLKILDPYMMEGDFLMGE
jgi:hypothetical protein